MATTYVLAASATECSDPKQLTPQLSVDGRALYNGAPLVVYAVDPNPPKNQAFIPPPLKLSTLPEKATATFSITYIANGGTDLWGEPCYTFPEEAKAAFNAAADIWGNLLQSTVPITIKACWAGLSSPGTLGYSGGGSIYRDFSGAPLANTWYSSSLANALKGVDLDPSQFDMHITYNRNFTWYYGTDGATPSGQYDLMSVVLHEIAHGLNFSGSMRYSSGAGSWGYTTVYPNIYDTFMRDGTANPGNLLTNTGAYANPSVALGSALTSQSIWFHGASAMTANGGTRVKMYAPSTWSSGSSYSHLDYATFSGGANRLMVYAISAGVATHMPGPVTLGIFADLGWPTSNNPVPAISTLSPSFISGGGATFTLTVNGSNFLGNSVVRWNGADRATSFVSATKLTAVIAAADIANAGNFPVTVFNPEPGGGTSTAVNFTVNDNPVPVISSLNPSSATAGGAAFTLTVAGSNFVNSSLVRWNGTDHMPISVSDTQLTVTMPAGDITGATTLNISVFNPPPAGGTSNVLTFTVTAAPPAPAAVVGGGGGGGGGCFIATAAFGSPLEKNVGILREFRDRCLLKTTAGKAFVKFYYDVSPPIAGLIAQNDVLRFITRCSLMPVVGMAYWTITYGAATTLLSMLFFILVTGALIWSIRRKMIVVRK